MANAENSPNSGKAGSSTQEKTSPSVIPYITIDGTINPGSSDYLKTSIATAEKNRAEVLIVELNTPGGLLSSTREIIQNISQSKVPVVVYVTPGGASATSAGAIISIASHFVAMAPGTNIGAAHPVAAGKDIEGDMGKKVTNDTAALIRSQAKIHDRDVELSEKLVTESHSFSETEALKKNLIEAVAKDKQELLRILDGKAFTVAGSDKKVVVRTENAKLELIAMSPAQKFLHIIANPNISTILMALGGLAIYSEITSGFSLIFPGVVGVILLILAFISLQTLPINIGAVALFFLGIVLIVAEAYVTSFGVLSVLGVASITIGALFLIDPAGGNIAVSLSVLLPMVGTIGLLLAIIGYMFARDRSMTIDEFGVKPGETGKVRSVSETGKEGQIFLHGELWQFQSDDKIAVGDTVIVEKVDSLKLKVKRS